jgi:hypothetical protein
MKDLIGMDGLMSVEVDVSQTDLRQMYMRAEIE